MPKPKKDKGDKKTVGGHKGAAKEQRLDEPSRVGSSHYSENGQQQGEKGVETARYASITGSATPPPQEISEKV
jgi:ATP-binding cassette subfamily G (WHITE) protein 2 (PDR)